VGHMTLVVECPPGHGAERRYALDVLLGVFLGLEYQLIERPGEHVVIRRNDRKSLYVSDILFRHDGSLLDSAALPREPLQRCMATALVGARVLDDVPVLYGDPSIVVEEQSIRLAVDLFGGAFALLTRLEEAVVAARDIHGRFPASASLALRAGFLDRPLVNEYAEILWWALKRLWPDLDRRPRAFRVLPTHDVDWPYYSRGLVLETIRDAARDLARKRGRRLAQARLRSLRAVRSRGRGADPCNTFNFLMDESDFRGLRSAFYFMTGQTNKTYDPGYSIDDPWLRDLLVRIAARGHEVGFHPSYETPRDEATLRHELNRLRAATGQQPLGGRQHFLRWDPATTWRNWDAVGLSYDSTLGFAAAPGFRCGACYEFPVFDLQERRALDLVERPLIAMDATLLVHQALAPEAAAEEMRRLREICRVFDGDFVFLWHNDRLTGEREREAYRAVLS
jgi:hypothetical protein